MNIISKFKNWFNKNSSREYTINGIKFDVQNNLSKYAGKVKSLDSFIKENKSVIDINTFLFDLSIFLNSRKYQFVNNRFDGNNQPYNVSITYAGDYTPSSLVTYVIARFRLSVDGTGEEMPNDVLDDMADNVKSYFHGCKSKYLDDIDDHGVDTNDTKLYNVTHEQFNQRGYVIFEVTLSY